MADQQQTSEGLPWWPAGGSAGRFYGVLRAKFSGKYKLALLVIAAHAGEANECTASLETLAEELSISLTSARRTVRELIEAGCLQRLRRRRSASILAVCWERLKVSKMIVDTSLNVPKMRPLQKCNGLIFDRDNVSKMIVDTTYKKEEESNTMGAVVATDNVSKMIVDDSAEGERRRRFVPPTAAEVAAYVAEIGGRIDPDRFVDHYASNGWMCGKTKMKDWRAAVRNWNRNEAQFRRREQRGLFDGIEGALDD